MRLLFIIAIFTSLLSSPQKQRREPTVCDNSGAPDKDLYVHNCKCERVDEKDCDKTQFVVPSSKCTLNCHPDSCKCQHPECS